VAERSSITQSVQIGVETTPGTAVAASKRLGSLGIAIGPATSFNNFRPVGQKYSSLNVLGQEWTEADLEGAPVYTELPYAFASVVNTPTISQIMDGATPTGAYRWTFESNTFGDDTPKTFTVEQGSSVRAHRVANCILTELGMDWSREEISLSGSWLAKALEDGVTLTSSPTGFDQIPVKPSDLSVYLDTTAAGLGTTKLLRALKGSFSIADRYNPLWVVDAAEESFVATVEGEPKVEFKMTQMADAAGMANLLSMRNGDTVFLRLQGQGPKIYTGIATPVGDQYHTVTIDMAGQVSDVSSFGDEDGVYAIEWTFGAVHDPTWGKSSSIEVITTTATL
jgi:hypothetical protein